MVVNPPAYDPIELVAGVQWELAKGHLRAVVAAQGARLNAKSGEGEVTVYERARDAVDAFIDDFEHQELNLNG